jgi:hypothetical protein
MRTPAHPQAALLSAAILLAAGRALAQQADAPRYPLRLHILAIDDTHRTERLQPNWCSNSIPVVGDGDGSSGGGTPSCGGGGSLSFGGGDDDFSGGGRADLVTLPGGATQALSFTYEGCNRVRVPPGFQGLSARWKKPSKLEVQIPSDGVTESDRPAPMQRCTLAATMLDFVYLRLANGSMLKVTQEGYARKPALRRFLSGGTERLQPRVTPTVSVKQLAASPTP